LTFPLLEGIWLKDINQQGDRMLSIGEFSNICKLSAKTLRYYSEIGLIEPDQVNPKTGYRYYSIGQLEKILFINRLKSYNFSLDKIKSIVNSDVSIDEILIEELTLKKKDFKKSIQESKYRLNQLQIDISTLKQGKSIMSYLENIDVQLVEFPETNIISVRKKIFKCDMALEYQKCFNRLFKKVIDEKLTIVSQPMVLFHSSEFTEDGLDTEIAIQVKDCVTGTRDFDPKLCLKTVLKGSYSELPSIYTKHCNYADTEGYKVNGALFEIYITDPSQVNEESQLITEVYLPVKKLVNKL
jgi:DNA-binding transcriptional MerR regulator/effector-binding domain-containing protein